MRLRRSALQRGWHARRSHGVQLRHLPALRRAVGVLLAEEGDDDGTDRHLYARRPHAGDASLQDVPLPDVVGAGRQEPRPHGRERPYAAAGRVGRDADKEVRRRQLVEDEVIVPTGLRANARFGSKAVFGACML